MQHTSKRYVQLIHSSNTFKLWLVFGYSSNILIKYSNSNVKNRAFYLAVQNNELHLYTFNIKRQIIGQPQTAPRNESSGPEMFPFTGT